MRKRYNIVQKNDENDEDDWDNALNQIVLIVFIVLFVLEIVSLLDFKFDRNKIMLDKIRLNREIKIIFIINVFH